MLGPEELSLLVEQGPIELERLFVLTTQTSHWFRERGFDSCDIDDLPETRRAHYDQGRRSKVLLKQLG